MCPIAPPHPTPITGAATFPRQLRYFSIATYDTNGMPLQVITDFQIQPTTGVYYVEPDRTEIAWLHPFLPSL